MILPIVGYGAAILREKAKPIDADYEGLPTLIENMWETLYNSNGVGLAAPQINKSIQLFLVDSEQIFATSDDDDDNADDEVYPDAPGFKGVFINPTITDLAGKEWAYNEGCLSIPKIREDVNRLEVVNITYLDDNFQQQTKQFNGITARIILHEFDHLQGKLFIDYLKPLKKTLLKRKLKDISEGKVKTDYKMIFPK